MWTTKKDVLEALERIDFLRRSEGLSKAYTCKTKEKVHQIDKKRVFDIIEKFGYIPGHEGAFFYVKNQFVGPFSFEMRFNLKYAIGDFHWIVYEEGEIIYGGPWLLFERELKNDMDFSMNAPSFQNYEELEGILAIAFEMFEDFKKVLCKKKGLKTDED